MLLRDQPAAPLDSSPSESRGESPSGSGGGSARLARSIPRLVAEVVIAGIGVTLLAGALAANQHWLDRHFLPTFLLPRDWYVRLETSVRVAMAALGLWLALVTRPRVGRFVARAPARTLHVTIAVLLALGASELLLHRVHLQPAEWLLPDEEPLRHADARLGWTFVPSRTGHATIGGRVVDYAFDAAGYRVRRVDDPVDPERPTILFTGESVMFGEGLTWDESVPAQVGAMMGLQSANLAVHGFASDQSYLRLQMELPRFHRPVAVVSLFMTTLFGRNLDHERPHLGPGLVWLPGRQSWRLQSLARLLVPYHSDAAIEQGISATRDVLRATVDLARAHGATALIVVPQLGPDDEEELMLRRRILDEPGLPYIRIAIDPAWRLPGDRHPDARAAHAIAGAIADRLRHYVSGQRSAVSDQRSAISGQRSAVSGQRSAVSDQRSAVSDQRSAISGQPSAVSNQLLMISSSGPNLNSKS